jgi:phosphoenolpyruvate-protein kinase (PTS system EI component)
VNTSEGDRIIRGVAASAGVVAGHVVRAFDPEFISFNYKLKASDIADETARFKQSVDKSRRQLRRMQQELKRRSGPESSFLIDAHLLILQDSLFVDRIIDKSCHTMQSLSDVRFRRRSCLNCDPSASSVW